MSEFETLKNELQEVKGLLKQILRKEEPKKKEWVSAKEACAMLRIKSSTLASYRHNRVIEFRSPRPYQYSLSSINNILMKRTIKTSI